MPIHRHEHGREFVLMRLHYVSRPPGLPPLASRESELIWLDVRADPQKYHRPQPQQHSSTHARSS